MKVTEHEMRGLLTGKCVPADMLVNEELPAYVVRKFADLHSDIKKQETAYAQAVDAILMALKDKELVQDRLEDTEDELQESRENLDAVLAENVGLKCGAEYFMYSPDCGFERYRSHAEAIKAANEMIDDYRADAHDGWCDEVEGVCVGVILKYAQQCEEQKPSEENGFLGSVNYVMPEAQTPITDAILNEVRAEGVEMFAAEREELRKHYVAKKDREMAVSADHCAMAAFAFAEELRARKVEGAIYD